VAPDATAGWLTSTMKKCTGGMGGRTMYAAVATYSTVPAASSGRSAARGAGAEWGVLGAGRVGLWPPGLGAPAGWVKALQLRRVVPRCSARDPPASLRLPSGPMWQK
jgi:hypothetical protein